MNDKSIKQNIREFRKQLGLSQDEVADSIKLSRNAYRKIEMGDTKMVNSHLEDIAAALSVPVSVLMLGYDINSDNAPILIQAKAQYANSLESIKKDTQSRMEVLENENIVLKNRINELEANISIMQDLINYLKKDRKND